MIIEWGVGAEGDGDGDGTDGFDSVNPRCAAIRSDIAEVLAALAVDEVECVGFDAARLATPRDAEAPRRGARAEREEAERRQGAAPLSPKGAAPAAPSYEKGTAGARPRPRPTWGG